MRLPPAAHHALLSPSVRHYGYGAPQLRASVAGLGDQGREWSPSNELSAPVLTIHDIPQLRHEQTAPNSVIFETTVAVTGNNTGIVVPEEAIEQLAADNAHPCWSTSTGTNTGTRPA